MGLEVSPLQRVVPRLEADRCPRVRQRQVAGRGTNDRDLETAHAHRQFGTVVSCCLPSVNKLVVTLVVEYLVNIG